MYILSFNMHDNNIDIEHRSKKLPLAAIKNVKRTIGRHPANDRLVRQAFALLWSGRGRTAWLLRFVKADSPGRRLTSAVTYICPKNGNITQKGKIYFSYEVFDKMRGKRRRYGCCYSPKIGVTYKDNRSTMPVLCRKGEANSWDATDALRRHTIDL